MALLGSTAVPGTDAAGGVAVPAGGSSYPGGKSGPGIYQRLINLIPRHRILISAFAGQCGVVRNIKPADHTIVIDADPNVCAWWDGWRRSKEGRDLEIHHCDSIEWLRYRFGLTEYSAPGFGVARDHGEDRDANRCGDRGSRSLTRTVMGHGDRKSPDHATSADDVPPGGTAASRSDEMEAFLFIDPPYVLSERSHGKQYACELTDDDHRRLLQVVTRLPASRAAAMLCGYPSSIYATVDREWRAVDHRVPTRGGLQDERIWMNYANPRRLHDYRYVGDCRRSRERIRRRQRSWVSQLEAMPELERCAMLEVLRAVDPSPH
ncbi:MAG: hypothetical protein AAGC97_17495 [Planctomycetota bacterium]